MRNRSRRHHLVSKFYLRYFAEDNERVRTVELPGEPQFTQSIKDASVRTEYFTVIDNEGEKSDVLEAAFGLVEAEAAEAWRAVADGEWPLGSTHREGMAGWVALHLLRTDSTRTSMTQLMSGGLALQIAVGGRERLREILREQGGPHDDSAVNREWLALWEAPLEVEVTPNHHAHHLANLLPTVTAALMDRLWVLTVYSRKGLATSDHPVVVVPNPEDVAVCMGTGIANAREIAVPLTRRLHLGLALRNTPDGDLTGVEDVRQNGTTQMALWANSVCSLHARRYLYHHPDDSPLAGLDLPKRRSQEVQMSGSPWQFMSQEDRQVLLDAGLGESTSRVSE